MKGALSFFGLGSNLGDRQSLLKSAVEKLARKDSVSIERSSSIYETPAWGNMDQPPFLNLVLQARVSLDPHQLLESCLSVERELGRVRREKWGARCIDIDVLWIEGVEILNERLAIPHPGLTERPFVMIPLAELAPDLGISGKKARDWARQLSNFKIKKLFPPPEINLADSNDC